MRRFVLLVVAFLLCFPGLSTASTTTKRGFTKVVFESAEGGVSGAQAVVFKTPFSHKPGVLMTVNATNITALTTWVQNASVSGFEIGFRDFDDHPGFTRKFTVYWEARA